MSTVEIDLQNYEYDQMIAEREYESELEAAKQDISKTIDREWDNGTLRVSYAECNVSGVDPKLLSLGQWLSLVEKALIDIREKGIFSAYLARADKDNAEDLAKWVITDDNLDACRELLNSVLCGEPSITFAIDDVKALAYNNNLYSWGSMDFMQIWKAAEKNILREELAKINPQFQYEV